MIDGERLLDAVLRQAVLHEDRPGVVDQHVQPIVAALELLGGPTDLRLGAQVASQRLHPVVTGGPADLRGRVLGLAQVAGEQHHPVPLLRQRAGGDLADSRRRSRDQRDPFHGQRLRARSISRFASFSAIASRLSAARFPFATPISTFTWPSLKYSESGMSAYPPFCCCSSSRSISRRCKSSLRVRFGSWLRSGPAALYGGICARHAARPRMRPRAAPTPRADSSPPCRSARCRLPPGTRRGSRTRRGGSSRSP